MYIPETNMHEVCDFPLKDLGVLDLGEFFVQPLRLEDARAFYEQFDRNRQHISTFEPEAEVAYPNTFAVIHHILTGYANGEYQAGIWERGLLQGGVYLSPEGSPSGMCAEIGYWKSQESTTKGMMTTVVKALSRAALRHVETVFGQVHPDNHRSATVLKNSGFTEDPSFCSDWPGFRFFVLRRSMLVNTTENLQTATQQQYSQVI